MIITTWIGVLPIASEPVLMVVPDLRASHRVGCSAGWAPGRDRAEGEEMSEKTESFDAFLSHWINERIQKLGEVDPVDREEL
jgi:hypothetical protein